MSDKIQPEYQAWLDGLKPGDEVAFRGSWRYPATIATVVKRTPSGRIYAGTKQFNPDGRVRDPHSYYRLQRVTQDIIDEIELERLRNWIACVKWRDVPLAKLKAIKAIMDRNGEG